MLGSGRTASLHVQTANHAGSCADQNTVAYSEAARVLIKQQTLQKNYLS